LPIHNRGRFALPAPQAALMGSVAIGIHSTALPAPGGARRYRGPVVRSCRLSDQQAAAR
jgi:hypothetical protein